MILEILIGGLLFGAAAAAISSIIDWASNVISRAVDVVFAVLHGIRQTVGAVFKVLMQKRNGQWTETTRTLSEREVPDELRNIGAGRKLEISRWS